jgi:HEAT repeat protein
VDVAQRYAPSQRQARAPSQSELYAVVTADPDPAARRAAIDGLGDDLSASSELLRALGADEEPVVRRWAALALERRANPALASALRQAAISETDLAVRHILERALTRTGG